MKSTILRCCCRKRPQFNNWGSLRHLATNSTRYEEEVWQFPNVIDVNPLAEELRQTVRSYTQSRSLKLVGILADDGPFCQDAEMYSERIAETFQQDHINYELWRCPTRDPADLTALIQQANNSDHVHGILVFYPIFSGRHKGPYKNRLTGVYYKTHDEFLRDVVHVGKDVEGLGGTKWYHNPRRRREEQTLNTPPVVYPCTAKSVQTILERYHWCKSLDGSRNSWNNQTVSVVNRSEIVGRPLATMLAASGATVYSIDADTILKFQPNGGRLQRCPMTLEDCLAESDVVVTGVPHPSFQIPTMHLNPGATLVNVSEFSNVDEMSLLERPDLTYIPHVGKVTVAVLEQNLVRLHQHSTQGLEDPLETVS